MKINNWQQKYLYIYLFGSSNALIRFTHSGQNWLLDCSSGCQHILAEKKVKIAQVTRIIVVGTSIASLNGLLGLLSTISLHAEDNGRIEIYGSKWLYKYIFWGRKYSRTNFRYRLYFYDLSSIVLVRKISYSFYALINQFQDQSTNYHLITSEQPGEFNSRNACLYSIPFGPLLGFLKSGQDFILPDGSIVYSSSFIYGHYLGGKIILIDDIFRWHSVSKFRNPTRIIYR